MAYHQLVLLSILIVKGAQMQENNDSKQGSGALPEEIFNDIIRDSYANFEPVQSLTKENSQDTIGKGLKTLRTELRDARQSQMQTRSTLILLQEKQQAQELDLTILKDEVLQIKQMAKENRKYITDLKMAIEDNNWAIRDLKSHNDLLKKDISTIKHLQNINNDSLGAILTANKAQKSSLATIQEEISDLRHTLQEERVAVQQLQGGLNDISKPWMNSHITQQFNNLLDHFIQNDSELTKAFTLLYNLSLNLTKTGSNAPNKEQSAYQSDLKQLLESFLNFTKQVNRLCTPSKLNNNSWMYTAAVNRLEEQIIELKMQLKHLQDRTDEDRMKNQYHWLTAAQEQQQVNITMDHFNTVVKQLEQNSFKLLDDQSKQLGNVQSKLLDQDNRLLNMQVQILNTSMESCKKTSNDLLQYATLAKALDDVTTLQVKTDDLANHMSRVDKGVGKLFDLVDKTGNTLTDLLKQIQTLNSVIADVEVLQGDVRKLIKNLPTGCEDIQHYSTDGFYLIRPVHSPIPVWVQCQFTINQTWTIVQHRKTGVQSFAQPWTEYKKGFGDGHTDFWTGLDSLHYLTKDGAHTVRFEMWDINGRYWLADYDTFKILGEEDKYMLVIGGYHGNATDGMRYSNGTHFSSQDEDNDLSSTHCAKFYTAGWWYKHCHYANLNGRFNVGMVWFNHDMDEWIQLNKTSIKLRD